LDWRKKREKGSWGVGSGGGGSCPAVCCWVKFLQVLTSKPAAAATMVVHRDQC